MPPEIELILKGDKENITDAVKTFNENYARTFDFSFLNENNARRRLVETLFKFISLDNPKDLHKQCLAAIRILSRDKRDLDKILDIQHLDLLKKCAGFSKNAVLREEENNYDVEIEALKCLCNIIYNSPVAAAYFSKNEIVEGIIDRLRNYKRLRHLPPNVKIFHMKVLFLITALFEETRSKLNDELHGLKYLTELLESLASITDVEEQNVTGQNLLEELSSDELALACEVLKVVFNLTLRQSSIEIDEEEESHYGELVIVLRNLLEISTHDKNEKLELINNIVNLLTNMPLSCYHLLYKPVKDGEHVPKHLQYEGQNMKAVQEILFLLESKFSNEITIKSQQEMLSPLLTVLVKCATSDKYLRKYLRQKILPPLRDVHTRPEEGNTLRNNLCRLLTTPITNVRDLAADLLFVLCKENVGRMIKYTGYGNSAGLFANRGLLRGGRPGEHKYSSESEDSDTEEYREHKHGINPVIGCYEPPKPNPMANMSEEQKEYEAMKLVNLMDNLTRSGVIQPCKIGEDGRPEPVEHVLQLQEGLPAQQVRRSNEQNDDEDN